MLVHTAYAFVHLFGHFDKEISADIGIALRGTGNGVFVWLLDGFQT